MIEDLEEKYKCQLPLGEGSLGTLWRAEAIESGRATALAVFEPEGPDSEELCEAFLARAKILTGLDHANVVRVFDHGMVANGSAYMAMELLEGRSLAERLADTPAMTIEELVEVGEQVLSGLGAVHDAGIVHGDMEPGNIFLVARGNFFFPKIIGFALSRAAARRGDGADGDGTEGDEGLVRSLAYMSPEQARRDTAIGSRSDIYSMGVVLYEAIAGRLPYRAADPSEMRQAIARGGCAPLFRVKKEVAGALAGAIERAMVPDPEKRMPDAKSLRKALLSSLIVSPKLAKVALPVGPRGLTEPGSDDEEAKTNAEENPTNGKKPVLGAPSPPRVPAPAAWKPLPPGARSASAATMGVGSKTIVSAPKPASLAKGGMPMRSPVAMGKRAPNPMSVTDVGYPPPSVVVSGAAVAVLRDEPTSRENDTLDDDTEDRTEIKPSDLAMRSAAPVPAMPRPTAVDEEELSASQIIVSGKDLPGDAEDFIATRPPPAAAPDVSRSAGTNGKGRNDVGPGGAGRAQKVVSPIASDQPPAVRDAAFPPLDDLPTQDQSAALIPKKSPRQRGIHTQKLPAVRDLQIAADPRRGIPPGVLAGVGAFAGVVVVGVIGLLMLRSSAGDVGGEAEPTRGSEPAAVASTPTGGSPTVAGEPEGSMAALTPRTVTVQLRGVPEGGRVEHNRRAVQGNVIEVGRVSASDTITVTAPGCETWQKRMRPVANEYPDARSRQWQEGTIEAVEYAVSMQCRAPQPSARERRAAEQRAAEERAAQQRVEQERAAQQRAELQRAEQQRAEEASAARATQQRAAQQRAERAEQQRAERAAQQRAAQQRLTKQRAAQQRAAQQPAAQPRPAQPRNVARPTPRGSRGRPSLARDPGF